MDIGDVWWKIDSRSNCHGTCKFLISTIIDFNKTYLNQTCNINIFSLTIGAMGICMFSKLAIGCRVS
jgi:hypothetical protein